MKRRSGRVVLLFGVLVVVLLAVAAFLLLSPSGGDGGVGGLLGGPEITPTPRSFFVVQPVTDIDEGYYITTTEFFKTVETTQSVYASADYLHNLNEVKEKVAVVKLLQDVPVRAELLGQPGLAQRLAPGKRAFALQVDILSGIVGHLKKNDYVDMVLSGITEEYFPQTFPLSIQYVSPEGRPEFIPFNFPWTPTEPLRMLTVKTAIEDIRVLEVISITAQAAQANVTPTPGPAGLPAGWILLLEVNQQQAEVLRYALDEGWAYQLILRPYGEHIAVHDPATTTGISTWILLDPEGGYRMPVPQAIRYPVDTEADLPVGIVP
jgi:Flp pilus assembly protein CpaB